MTRYTTKICRFIGNKLGNKGATWIAKIFNLNLSADKYMSDVITSKIVAENKRLAFLPCKLPRYFLQFESHVYYFASNIIKEYSDAEWEFIELSNQGFYMRPSLGGSKVVVQFEGNGFSGLVSEDAVGIIATIFSLNYLLFEAQEEGLYKHYESLIDYARLHEERQQIFAAID